MANCSANQSTQHISSALIGRENTVSYEKRDSTSMVSYYSQGRHLFRVRVSSESGSVQNRLCDGSESISVKHGRRALHNCRNPFEAHPCIDPFSLKELVFSFFITVELNKDKVPDFHKPVTIATDSAVRLSASERFSAVYMNF